MKIKCQLQLLLVEQGFGLNLESSKVLGFFKSNNIMILDLSSFLFLLLLFKYMMLCMSQIPHGNQIEQNTLELL